MADFHHASPNHNFHIDLNVCGICKQETLSYGKTQEQTCRKFETSIEKNNGRKSKATAQDVV